MLKKLIFITAFLFSSSVLALNVEATYNSPEGCSKKMHIYLKDRAQFVRNLKSEILIRMREENMKFAVANQRIYCGQGQRELGDRETVGSCLNSQGDNGMNDTVKVELKTKG